MSQNPSVGRTQFVGYRLIRVGSGVDDEKGFLRVHRCYYASKDMLEVVGIEIQPAVLAGDTRLDVLKEIERLVDGIGQGIIRSDEITI